jgi:ATP-binding protein involved in chromosome partitioning
VWENPVFPPTWPWHLAGKGFSTGLLDVDLHGPSIAGMLGIKGLAGCQRKPAGDPQKGGRPFKGGFHAIPDEGPDQAVIWRGPAKTGIIRQFIAEVRWGSLDFLIVDSPPGTGDEPLSVAQTIIGAKALIVTTPQDVALGRCAQIHQFLPDRQFGVPGAGGKHGAFCLPVLRRNHRTV